MGTDKKLGADMRVDMSADKKAKDATWIFELLLDKLPKFKDLILLVGLPGIGNVGKIAADFIIEDTKARPLFNIFSHTLPNSVFINEENLVELPEIAIYYRRLPKAKNDLIILTGDVQPSEERSTYEFCEDVLAVAKKLGVVKVITLGGIGLGEVPAKPALYCTGNSVEAVKAFIKGVNVNKNLYGAVGPIIGVSGIMVALAKRQNIPAVCVLSETLGHPAYLGIKGARELVSVLNKKLSLNVRLKNLDREIEEIEGEVAAHSEDDPEIVTAAALKKLKSRRKTEMSYIG
jgi:uncharacterized protein (TIGR00162 family)